MKMTRKQKFIRFITLRSITSKVLLGFLIAGAFLVIASNLIFTRTLTNQEEQLINEMEASDIRYMEDFLDPDGGWHIEDHTLYKGSNIIGNGTEEDAHITPFLELESKTGTFFYAFIYAKYADPEIKAEINARIETHTNYIRVAGSTRGANGESIVGTYMDTAVSDYLADHDHYCGEANVQGRAIYCRYENLRDDEGNIVGAIVVGRSMVELNEQINSAKHRATFIIVVALLMATLGMLALFSRWIRALDAANRYLTRIGEGDIPELALELNTRDELDSMAHSINSMTDALRESERLGAELKLATNIQAHMLPSIFPAFPDHNEFDIFATMDPAKEVGGDFYDFFMLDERNLAVVIADVSGKGVPAALFMVIAKTLIKNHAQSGLTPAEVFTKTNQMLCEGNDDGLFVTGWMGVLDLETGILTYVNAGHNPPMLKLGNGGFEYLRVRAGFVLAGMEGIRYRQSTLQMEPGDRLFLYTDGVTEATNGAKRLFGEDRLAKYLNSHVTNTARELLLGLRSNINSFVGQAEQFDDITMLILDYQKKKEDDGMTEREFPASDTELDHVIGYVEEELEKMDAPMKVVMQITVAVEEIFVNIAHYAYSDGTGRMTLSIGPVDEDTVKLVFSDHGMPFDPLQKADPDITLSAEERDIGGLGIYMVRKTMTEVNYAYENGANVLTLVKKLR